MVKCNTGIEENVGSEESPEVVNQTASEGGTGSVKLPEYDGVITPGGLVLDDGTQISFTSGNGDPRYTNYANNGHVE